MTTHASGQLVAGELALAEFRQGLTGAYALDLLEQAAGRLLVQLAVGVGKSEWMGRIIVHALTADTSYDLVVVLVPRWDILRELEKRLPAALARTILYPRPRKQCGALDESWAEYEATGCGLLGKEQLCGICPLRSKCTWPQQYGSQLQGVRLILATQQHLTLDPHFIRRLCQRAGAKRTLVMLDESDFLVRNIERTIRDVDLERFVSAQQQVLDGTYQPSPSVQHWLENSQLIRQASTEDLRQGRWSFPQVDIQWAMHVQQAGRQEFGSTFHFLAYELQHFTQSDVTGRERLPNGDIRFAVPTDLGTSFAIFSGSMAKELARYRLDPNHSRPRLTSPFAHHRFEHPDTRWYNLNLLDGAAKFFPKNAERILDFFAHKVLRNIQAGKRTLLVARKKFLGLCRMRLRKRLVELGAGDFRIVSGNWKKHDLLDPRVLPLINYGVSGLNRFQHCEAAYCLTGYYISAATLAKAVQDLDPSSDQYPIAIECRGSPRQRQARVQLPDDRQTILPTIAAGMLEQKEADVIVQAVGRVRPFTRPREVITMYTGELPGVGYTLQFQSLPKARAFFAIATPKQSEISSKAEQARRLRVQGKSKKAIAQEMNVSLSTIKRYLRLAGGQIPLS